MIGSSIQRQADTLEGCLDRRMPLNVEAKTASDGVDLGRIKRDAATVDRCDQLPGTGVVGKWGVLTEKQGLEPGEKARRPA